MIREVRALAIHPRPPRGDARCNCLNLKGVIAIKLVAAPRYHLRPFATLCAGMRHLPLAFRLLAAEWAAANRCQNVAGTSGTLGTSAPDNVTADEWKDISGTVMGRTLAV
jgi:hypothetical protein